MDYDTIKNLNKLLKSENGSDSDDDFPAASHSKIGPGHIGPRKSKTVDDQLFKENENNSQEIWDEREVDEMRFEEYNDHRKVPEYDIKYSQSVSPEDIYLQMGCRTPLSSSCENMIVTVNMKGESSDRIDLNVQSTRIDVRSPMYRNHYSKEESMPGYLYMTKTTAFLLRSMGLAIGEDLLGFTLG